MRYRDFEPIVSEERMRRYVSACGGDTRKAMTLYHLNLEQCSKHLRENRKTEAKIKQYPPA